MSKKLPPRKKAPATGRKAWSIPSSHRKVETPVQDIGGRKPYAKHVPPKWYGAPPSRIPVAVRPQPPM